MNFNIETALNTRSSPLLRAGSQMHGSHFNGIHLPSSFSKAGWHNKKGIWTYLNGVDQHGGKDQIQQNLDYLIIYQPLDLPTFPSSRIERNANGRFCTIITHSMQITCTEIIERQRERSTSMNACLCCYLKSFQLGSYWSVLTDCFAKLEFNKRL